MSSRKLTFILLVTFFLLAGCNGDDQPVTAGDRSVTRSGQPEAETPDKSQADSTQSSTKNQTPTPASEEIETETGAPSGSSGDEEQSAGDPTATPSSTLAQSTESVQDFPPNEPTVEAPYPGTPVKSISLELVMTGFERPTFLTHAGDQRLFVSEQEGRIWAVSDGQVVNEPFLDISRRVDSGSNEQGLLSVAFHPNYPSNGYFYVNYTGSGGDTVVSRFEVSNDDPNRADAGSETVIMTADQPYGNHNGGQLQFGPDGYLFIGMGDGGSGGDPGNNGQNPATLLGSLLRIDVDSSDPYTIPPDNPFVNDPSARDEAWAIGLRNPWRFSFDREAGDLYIADVGQNQWEEINYQSYLDSGGANYGWNSLEANHCYNADSCETEGFVMPVAEYSHREGGCSVTGGYVYGGSADPALHGNYFFGDYCSGRIWSLFRHPAGEWEMTEVAQIRASIASFGEDSAGEIYVLDLADGAIYQIHE